MTTEIIRQNDIVYTLQVGERESVDGGGARQVQTGARIVRQRGNEKIVLFDYAWPYQLIPTLSIPAESVSLTEDPEALHFVLHLDVHHIHGQIHGEFTEDETFCVQAPLSDAPVCIIEDIVRKTKFAIGPRHLPHVPRQTYPAPEGQQGPYGHPSVHQLPPIPVKKHISR